MCRRRKGTRTVGATATSAGGLTASISSGSTDDSGRTAAAARGGARRNIFGGGARTLALAMAAAQLVVGMIFNLMTTIA